MTDPSILLMFVEDLAKFIGTPAIVADTKCPNVLVLQAGEWNNLVPPGIGIFLSTPEAPKRNVDGAFNIWDWGIGVYIASAPGVNKTEGLLFCFTAASAIKSALEFSNAFYDLPLDVNEPITIHANDNSSTVVSLNYAKNFPL